MKWAMPTGLTQMESLCHGAFPAWAGQAWHRFNQIMNTRNSYPINLFMVKICIFFKQKILFSKKPINIRFFNTKPKSIQA